MNWTDPFEAVPDAVLGGAGALARVPRGVSPHEQRTLLCARCWQTFGGFARATCPQCGGARPDSGWPGLPYSFRDRYLFTRAIGRGGMGAVFFALDQHQLDESRRAVAVKVVPTAGSASLREALKRMFEREAAAAAMLAQSPHFVRVTSHDVGVEPAYLVMEFVDWPTLRGLLKRGQGEAQPLTPVKAARVGVALLRGLSAMHFHRIVHRDLKPDNVFVRRADSGEDYEVKILDLGVWTSDATDQQQTHSLPGLQRPDEGAPVGTFAYMSPEQMMQQPVGARSDLHTAGSLLWELITGHVPYPLSRREMTAAIRERVEKMRTPPPKPATMPDGLYEILTRALSFAPRQRFDSAEDMRTALKTWLAGTLQRTRAAVSETKSRLSVMEQETDALIRRLAPAQSLIVELEALRDKLRADQRTADEVAIEALAEGQQRSDRAFRAVSEKLSAFAEAVHEGVLAGEAATGDLPSMEVGADGVPVVAAGPAVAVDLGPDHDTDEDEDDGSSRTAVPEPPPPPPRVERTERRARSRLVAAAVAGSIGLGAALGAAVLAKGPAAPASDRSSPSGPYASAARGASDEPAEPARPAPAVAHVAPAGSSAPALYTATDPANLDHVFGAAHAGGRPAAAWSPDGSRVVSGGDDGVVRVWDADTGAPVARVSVIEAGAIRALGWTSDGRTIVVTSEDGSLRSWDVEGQNITGVSRAHAHDTRALALDAERRTIVTGGAEGVVRVWSSATAEPIAELRPAKPKKRPAPRPHGAVSAVAAASDRIVAHYADGTIAHWLATVPGAPIAKLPEHASAIALAPGGRSLVVGTTDGAIAIAELSGAATPRTLLGRGAAVTALAVSSDGRRVASAHDDHGVRLWDRASGAASASLAGAHAPNGRLAFAPHGRRILGGAADGSVLIWDTANGTLLRRVEPRPGAIRAIGLDGEQAIVIGPAVWRVDPATGARLTHMDAGTREARLLAIDARGRRAVTVDAGDSVRVLDLATGGPHGAAIALHARPYAAAVAPSARWIALATDDGRARVWGTDSGELHATIEVSEVNALVASPDDRLVATLGNGGALGVWSSSTGQRVLWRDLGAGPLTAAAWSPDGLTITVGSEDGRLARVDLARATVAPLARARSSPIRVIACAPDGRSVAVGGLDALVEVVSTEAGSSYALGPHPAAVTALQFTADGASLFAGGADGTTRIHALSPRSALTAGEHSGEWRIVAH